MLEKGVFNSNASVQQSTITQTSLGMLTLLGLIEFHYDLEVRGYRAN